MNYTAKVVTNSLNPNNGNKNIINIDNKIPKPYTKLKL